MHVISIISFSAVLKHDNVYQYLCCFNHNYNKIVSQSHLYVKFKSLPDSLRPGFKVGVVFLYVRLAIPTYPSSYHYLRLRHKLAIFNLNCLCSLSCVLQLESFDLNSLEFLQSLCFFLERLHVSVFFFSTKS